MRIAEEVYSEFFPIEPNAAIVCENDLFDKYNGGIDYIFSGMAKSAGADSFHYMHSFRNRMEAEIISAFKDTPAIIFSSSYKEVEWFELMLRCIIKSKSKAKIIGKSGQSSLLNQRFDKCIEIAKGFGIEIIKQ